MKTYHVKKDDKVMVNAGNYRGSEATVKAVERDDEVVDTDSRWRGPSAGYLADG